MLGPVERRGIQRGSGSGKEHAAPQRFLRVRLRHAVASDDAVTRAPLPASLQRERSHEEGHEVQVNEQDGGRRVIAKICKIDACVRCKLNAYRQTYISQRAAVLWSRSGTQAHRSAK